MATRALVEGNRKDAVLSADMAAYRRLIADGLEPKSLHGCRDLEARDATAAEIEGTPV